MRDRKLWRIGVAMIVAACLVSGCAALPSVQPEWPVWIGPVPASSPAPGATRVVFFNSSSKFPYGVDGSGLLNIRLDDRGVASLEPGQFVEIAVPAGRYGVLLTNRIYVQGPFGWEPRDINSNHMVDVSGDALFVEAYVGIVGHGLKVVPLLPEGYERKNLGTTLPVP